MEIPEFHLSVFLLGCGGGLLPDLIRLVKSRYESAWPDYFKSPVFLVSLGILILLGGFTAWIAGAGTILQALAYGFSAPEILSRLLGAPGKPGEPVPGRRIRLRRWWSF